MAIVGPGTIHDWRADRCDRWMVGFRDSRLLARLKMGYGDDTETLFRLSPWRGRAAGAGGPVTIFCDFGMKKARSKHPFRASSSPSVSDNLSNADAVGSYFDAIVNSMSLSRFTKPAG